MRVICCKPLKVRTRELEPVLLRHGVEARACLQPARHRKPIRNDDLAVYGNSEMSVAQTNVHSCIKSSRIRSGRQLTCNHRSPEFLTLANPHPHPTHWHPSPMDHFDDIFASLEATLDAPSEGLPGGVPVDEDAPSRAGVYCVIA
ncbi:hypothetical protein L226DRAFT_355066 [Lentinus tigrinus ALCF2SS1-7]|uniref:uncharacterized protein n=1 Tax=Lentinus tigrinus ALCF2SS1-7 TaxID=1328758 RepID=UPI001165F96D|nr:hypothetical protein L226DRAFT_355066 [Lentinus tigrinus ALCF2SS1-7]